MLFIVEAPGLFGSPIFLAQLFAKVEMKRHSVLGDELVVNLSSKVLQIVQV